jgi:OPA family glycerol-3-phosphate transporter-like MFS transporter
MMAATSGIWMLGMRKVHENAVLQVKKEVETRSRKIENKKIFLSAGIPTVCFVLMLQGMLKDGVITWVPVYIREFYSLSMEKAVLGTAILPVINLSGVYIAHQLNQKRFRNELSTAGVLFGGTVICMGLMWLSLGMGPIYSIVLLAASTTLMMGVNTLLASVLPVYFSKYQKSSSAAGLLNSSAYAGCAISSYGIGVLAEQMGWNFTVAVWGLAAVTGTMASFGAAMKWRKFRWDGLEH